MHKWLVFTDLDGTLLDHHTYSYEAAEPAITQLKQQGTSIILNSSKTLAELDALASSLALTAPVIAENGSVISIPGESPVFWGPDYGAICQLLDQFRADYGWDFQGFHDWTVEEVAKHTGLNPTAAAMAAQRQASEPIIWSDTEENREAFRLALEAENLLLKRGGRFWHVMGQTDKVKAMTYLAEREQRLTGIDVRVIALGDGPNDIGMLEAADVAVIVHNPDTDEIDIAPRSDQQVIKTSLPGPAGWNAAIEQIINQ